MTATTTGESLGVIIDTDPGLDDAVGILYALSSRRFAVAAMTAVAGNIGLGTTTRNIGRLLAAMERQDIPYAAGASEPLDGQGINEEAIHGADGLGGIDLPDPLTSRDSRPALSFLEQLLKAQPARTQTILALGPLTNLAQLALEAPAIYGRIRRIIAMGGTIDEPGNAGPHAEFNIAADPQAARIVFDAGVPVTLVPLDVTRKLRATQADLDRLAAMGTPAARLSADLIRAYFAANAGRQSRPLHDPCVMLMAAVPELFGTVPMRLVVDCQIHRGRLIRTKEGAEVDVAMTIKAAAALDALWCGLGAG